MKQSRDYTIHLLLALLVYAILVSSCKQQHDAQVMHEQAIKSEVYLDILHDLDRKYKIFDDKHSAEQLRIISLQTQGQRNIDLDTLHYWSGKKDGIMDAMRTIQDQVKQIP